MTEFVPAGRNTPEYLTRRNYRTSQQFVRIVAKNSARPRAGRVPAHGHGRRATRACAFSVRRRQAHWRGSVRGAHCGRGRARQDSLDAMGRDRVLQVRDRLPFDMPPRRIRCSTLGTCSRPLAFGRGLQTRVGVTRAVFVGLDRWPPMEGILSRSSRTPAAMSSEVRRLLGTVRKKPAA